MFRYSLLVFSFLLISIINANAQKLSSHRWNDRLVIIMANDQSNPTLKDQILELEKSETGLEERRITVYRVLPDKYQIGLEDGKPCETSGNIYEIMKETNADFEIVLIGLDGGIKLRRSELLKADELFGIIDQMPMRQAEMNKKN